MRFLIHIMIIVIAAVHASPLSAQPQVNPVVFTRSTITVLSAPKPLEKEEEQEQGKGSNEKESIEKEAEEKKAAQNESEVNTTESAKIIKHYFKVEMRTPDALTMEWFYKLDALKEKEGVMIMYNIPEIITLQPAKIYKPVDVVFIDEEGTIKAIAPNIVLSNINKAIQPDAPMKAMMFLKGDVTQKLGIAPGDTVVHPSFTSAPVILN